MARGPKSRKSRKKSDCLSELLDDIENDSLSELSDVDVKNDSLSELPDDDDDDDDYLSELRDDDDLSELPYDDDDVKNDYLSELRDDDDVKDDNLGELSDEDVKNDDLSELQDDVKDDYLSELSDEDVENDDLSELQDDVKNDYLSKFSDDILTSITSFLDMKDVVRTSSLAKRWREIWLNHSNLKFNYTDILGIHDNQLMTKWIDKDKFFVKLVDQIMEQRIKGSCSINSFCLEFELGKDFSLSIDRWIKCAVRKGVMTLDLRFTRFCFNLYCRCRSRQRFKRYNFSLLRTTSENKGSLKHLKLAFCNFRGRSSSKKFGSLVSIQLEKVNISNVQLTKVLESCPSLETLILHRCPNLTCLRIDSGKKSLLKILSLEDMNVTEMDLCATNLISLVLQNVHLNSFDLMKFIKSCPLLEELTLHKCSRLTHLNICDSYNPRLQFLSLKKCSSLDKIDLCVNNLRTLEYKARSRLFSFNVKAPKLVNAFLSDYDHLRFIVPRLCLDLPVENLVLWMPLSLEFFKFQNSLPKFSNVRQLALHDFLFINKDAEISIVGYVLKCFPFLQTLGLNVSQEWRQDPLYVMRSKETKKEAIEDCPNSTITRLELNGFMGYKQEHVDLLKYLLKNLDGLKVLAVGPSSKRYKSFKQWHHSEPSRSGKRWFEFESEWFRTVVPPSVHLEFMQS